MPGLKKQQQQTKNHLSHMQPQRVATTRIRTICLNCCGQKKIIWEAVAALFSTVLELGALLYQHLELIKLPNTIKA